MIIFGMFIKWKEVNLKRTKKLKIKLFKIRMNNVKLEFPFWKMGRAFFSYCWIKTLTFYLSIDKFYFCIIHLVTSKFSKTVLYRRWCHTFIDKFEKLPLCINKWCVCVRVFMCKEPTTILFPTIFIFHFCFVFASHKNEIISH